MLYAFKKYLRPGEGSKPVDDIETFIKFPLTLGATETYVDVEKEDVVAQLISVVKRVDLDIWWVNSGVVT